MSDLLKTMPALAGGLIEIVVLETTLLDWERFFASVVEKGILVSFTAHGSEVPPALSQAVFDDEDSPYLATLRLRDQTWTTTFFSDEQIDIQGDPREVVDAEDVRAVEEFMLMIASATEKTTLLVPETLDAASVEPLHYTHPQRLD